MTDLNLHTAIAVGIDKALRDLGTDLVGCTPSMLTGHVIKELREAGLHPSSPVDGTEVQWGVRYPWGFTNEHSEENARRWVATTPDATLVQRDVGSWRAVIE